MSILKSTNSGKKLVLPDNIDFINENFHLSYREKRYKFNDSSVYCLDVVFEDDCDPITKNYKIKNVSCSVWKNGIEYIMYITCKSELKLVSEYYKRTWYKEINKEELFEAERLKNEIIEISKKQYKEYKEKNFLTRE